MYLLDILKRYGKHYSKLSFPCFSVSLFCLQKSFLFITLIPNS
nr:MAG TPA: hypothetical protein [Caudoviricetes sp.]